MTNAEKYALAENATSDDRLIVALYEALAHEKGGRLMLAERVKELEERAKPTQARYDTAVAVKINGEHVGTAGSGGVTITDALGHYEIDIDLPSFDRNFYRKDTW